MSAFTWRRRLEDSQRQLGEVNNIAEEWKKVAENRKQMLVMITRALAQQVKELAKVGTIFGCSTEVDPLLVSSVEGLSGAELTAVTAHRMEAIAQFVGSLTREATELQVALNDTLGLANQALRVQAPTEDQETLSLEGTMKSSSFPITEVYDDLNQELEDIDVGTLVKRTQMPQQGDDCLSTTGRSLDALFTT